MDAHAQWIGKQSFAHSRSQIGLSAYGCSHAQKSSGVEIVVRSGFSPLEA